MRREPVCVHGSGLGSLTATSLLSTRQWSHHGDCRRVEEDDSDPVGGDKGDKEDGDRGLFEEEVDGEKGRDGAD